MLVTEIDSLSAKSKPLKNSSFAKYADAQWKHLPIPPPLPGQTEISLAQLLFDQKMCPCCKQAHSDIPPFVVLGINICQGCRRNKLLMRNTMITRYEAEDMFTACGYSNMLKDFDILINSLHRIRMRFHVLDYSFHQRSPHQDYFNREAWRILIDQYKEAQSSKSTTKLNSFLKRRSARAEILKKITQRATDALDTWIHHYEAHLVFLSHGFIGSAKMFAQFYEITLHALQMVPKFQQLLKESFTQPIFDLCVAAGSYLDEIIAESRNNHQRFVAQDLRKAEDNQLRVLRHYFTSYPFPKKITPAFETFISFSLIKSLRNSHCTDVITHEPQDSLRSLDSNTTGLPVGFDTLLNNPQCKKMLEDEVNAWIRQAISGARGLLGYGESDKPPSNRKNKANKRIPLERRVKGEVSTEGTTDMDLDTKRPLHGVATSQAESKDIAQARIWHKAFGKLDPEFRATAWFVCNVCQSLEAHYRRLGVLDFLGMCAHQCQRPDCSKRDPLKWAISNFAPALHAIETTRVMLKVLSLDEEDPSTKTDWFDGLWLCKNCPETMRAMQWEDLIRHSSRHSIPRLKKVSMGDAMDREQAREEGRRPFTVSQLISIKAEGGKKRLLCIHCMPTLEILLRAKSQVLGQTNNNGALKLMDIHGIRQHLRIKHKIDDMRNEDIYFLDGKPHDPVTIVLSEMETSHTTSDAPNSRVALSSASTVETNLYGYRCWECRTSNYRHNAMGLAAHFRAVHSNLSLSFRHPEFRKQEAGMAARREAMN
ncbi:hypothetical protein CPB86DRAFT_815548 [Serendipita vermifera]|nr:hypothetical protein CPB86DRAFT_815548 [Serendipita vermifera]